jgi:hypothetical protein
MSVVILYAILLSVFMLGALAWCTYPRNITNWKKDDINRSFVLRGPPPFLIGDIVECDVDIPGYHQRKGELYTVSSCFETKGMYGWNWWICVEETPVSKLASDFHLEEVRGI